MPHITIHSNSKTHRSAKIYAPHRGLSLSRSFRDRMRAVCGHGETRGANRSSVDAVALSVIKRYARIELTASEAMAALNFSDVEQLPKTAVQAGVPLPRPSKTAGLQLAKPLSARRKLGAHAQLHAGHHGRRPVGKVSCPQTLAGETAARKRSQRDCAPCLQNHRKNTGGLVAHDCFNNREDRGHPGQSALLLMDDSPASKKVKLRNLDVHILSTCALLVALEQDGRIAPSDALWADIERASPPVQKAKVGTSVRGSSKRPASTQR